MALTPKRTRPTNLDHLNGFPGANMIRHLLHAAAATLAGAILVSAASAEDLGSVTTSFHFLGKNATIGVEAFDDPGIPGVACHLSRARSGGMMASVGLGTDTSDASIACRQIGPITVDISRLADKEQVFKESTSPLFKSMQVIRFIDKKRNTLVYLVYSDKLIDGSPKNSISSVPVMPWGQATPNK